jgi:hypothetical protein
LEKAKEEANKIRCEAMGVVSGDCLDYQSVLSKLVYAPIAYNNPKRMDFDKRTEISLAVDNTGAADPASALEGLAGSVVQATTKIALNMSADLQGSAFKVEPSGQVAKIVTLGNITQWTWFVTPTECCGKKPITLSLYVQIQDKDKIFSPISVLSYRNEIEIKIGLWKGVQRFVGEAEPVRAFIAALLTASAAVGAWLLVRLRRTKKARLGDVQV